MKQRAQLLMTYGSISFFFFIKSLMPVWTCGCLGPVPWILVTLVLMLMVFLLPLTIRLRLSGVTAGLQTKNKMVNNGFRKVWQFQFYITYFSLFNTRSGWAASSTFPSLILFLLWPTESVRPCSIASFFKIWRLLLPLALFHAPRISSRRP